MEIDSDLKYAIAHGIIDVPSLHVKVLMEKRKETLRQHPHRIWQGKNGRWYTYVNDLESPGTRRLKVRNSKRELEDLLLEYYKQADASITIEEIFSRWNDWKLEMGKIGESTHYRNRKIFSRHYSEFGKRGIAEVSDLEFEEFLERQIPEFNLTAKAFSNLKSITKGFLKWARRRDYISWNYEYMLSNMEVSRNDFRKVIKEDCEEVYDEEEMELIMSYMLSRQDQLNLGLLLIFVTGIRVGELAALKHEDLAEDFIRIRRTETSWKAKDGKRYTEVKDFPKSAAGWRDVVLPTDYDWLLKALRLLNRNEEYVFVKGGKRCTEKAFECRLRRTCKKLGIVPKSPHKIRKTYGTILLDNAVDANMVIQQMGHTSILTSERHYHRNRKSNARKRKILDNLSDFDYSGDYGNQLTKN